MKKIILLLLVCLLLGALAGCNPYTTETLEDSSREEAFLQEVLDILERKDAQAFRPLFSPELAETEEFEGQIAAMFDYFQGQVQAFSLQSGPVSRKNKDQSEAYEIVSASYLVETDMGRYILNYQRCVENQKEPEIVGILSLNIQQAAIDPLGESAEE